MFRNIYAYSYMHEITISEKRGHGLEKKGTGITKVL